MFEYRSRNTPAREWSMEPPRSLSRYGGSTRPSLLVIGLGQTGMEVALALADSGTCCLSLGDDTVVDAEWRELTSCLLHRRSAIGPAAGAAVGKAGRRSQFLVEMLTPLSAQDIQAISPVGDASIVEKFDVVVMTDPTLPHAIAFNEHARAVGCGFLMTEARGAVGRLFRDLRGSRGCESWPRSLREALLDPRLSTNDRHHHGVENHADVPRPPWATASVRRENGAAQPLLSHHKSSYPCESVLSGLLSSSEFVHQRAKGEGERAAAAASRRHQQFHACFLALHMFCQEHGHLPVMLDREQADEIVRVADELVKTGENVPKGFSSQPESIDAALCRRVAKISRVSVPAVHFQLGGLAAAAALEYFRAHDIVHPSEESTVAIDDEKCRSKETSEQWMFVDELDSAIRKSDPGGRGKPTTESCERSIEAVDPPPLMAWLGASLSNSVAGARVAVIGCGNLGRDLARCLLLTGACTGPRGRMVFVDHGEETLSRSSSARRGECSHAGGSSIVPGRAAVLRDLVATYTGAGGSHTSAFNGGAQETNTEMDLWEGVDVVMVCAGRGGAARGSGRAGRGDCETLVRFVSHKCVLHGKPLIWGWAGAAGEGGAGVEVMAPGRTSCLVCSSHGGVKELIERRTTIRSDETRPPDGEVSPRRAPHASLSTTEKGDRHGRPNDGWDSNGLPFGVARSAVAGVMVAELVKVLKPQCRREELRNWRLAIDSGSSRCDEGDSSGYEGSGCGKKHSKEGAVPVAQQHSQQNPTTIQPAATTPDPPRLVLSTSFNPFSGGSLRAVPEGFTEWGVEEIKPSTITAAEYPRRGPSAVDDPYSLRVFVRTVFARFGVEAKAVAAAGPGSECRVGAGGCLERGGGCSGKIMWAEWEKVAGNQSELDQGRVKSDISKMDQSVLSLWKRVVLPKSHGKDGRRGVSGRKEPRFLYLDVRGVVGGENAVLPVLKYWVR